MTAPRIVMLLGNGFAPDPRVELEARALTDAGARVTVIAWDRDGDLPAEEDRDGIDVRRIRRTSAHGRGSSQALVLPRVWREMIRLGLDAGPAAVHAHDLDTLPAGWRLARRAGVPVVFDAHESYPDMLGSNVASPVRGVARRLEKFLVPRSDLVITVGDRLKTRLEELGARRCVVVGNWRDPAPATDAERSATRADAGVPDDALLLCFIANLTAERKLEPLLAAVESSPDVHLVVGGDGAAAPAARAAAERCGRIRYLGRVAPADVPRLTGASDAVYYGYDPELPNARFSAPNKLFEALAAGVPVVTGRFGEIGDIVEETGCGLLVPGYSEDALRDAFGELASPERRAGLREAARRAGERYTRRAADAALLEAYRGLLPALAAPA